jgi:CheY-like chemotaxis protein
MEKRRPNLVILMADDDLDDCLLAREALAESVIVHTLNFVHDGEELMDYLYRKGEYSHKDLAPRPDLILLDINMPKKDGIEALKEMKADEQLRLIPVVILTTSVAQEDIFQSYQLGANSYITKPVTFKGLVEVMQTLKRYWFDTVDLPMKLMGD